MEADRGRTPDSTPDRDLRRDIRRVTSILGETLARTEGDDLLALVEQVRAHAKEGRLDQLPDFDLATITRLVRAFTAYFHLANITEQVHRGRALTRASAEEGGWLERAVARIEEAGDRSRRGRVAAPAGRRASRLHRPPDRGRPALDDRQAASRRRAAGGARQPASDAPARGGGGAAVAHRRDPARASPSRPTRPATSSTTSRACPPAPCPTSSRSCATGSCRSGSTCRPTCVRSASAPGSAATATATPTSRPRRRARC